MENLGKEHRFKPGSPAVCTQAGQAGKPLLLEGTSGLALQGEGLRTFLLQPPAQQGQRSRACLAQPIQGALSHQREGTAVHVDISSHFTFGVMLYLSGWMIFKSISNSPRTNKASRITKQTTPICWRRRTNMNPLPAQTEEQEETHPNAHSPDSAGCVSWSILLLPHRTPTPAAPNAYSTWNHLAPHQTLPGVGGLGSWRRVRARAVVIVHWGLSPLRKHLHLQQSSSVPTGQLSSEAAAALAAPWGLTSSVLLPELHPTATLLSQVPLAWVCSASPETCAS